MRPVKDDAVCAGFSDGLCMAKSNRDLYAVYSNTRQTDWQVTAFAL
jgi:hypothetical protein